MKTISHYLTDIFDVDQNYLNSMILLEISRKVNLFLTLFLIVFGLIGHTLTILVYAQKRFRRNSSNVYLLCLAIVDSLYLIVHFFKNTKPAYLDIYSSVVDSNIGQLIQLINLIDRFDFACRLINYLRNVLRTISAYCIVALAIQRLFLVYSPFGNKFKFVLIYSLIFLSYILQILIFINKKGQQNQLGE